MKEDKNSLSFLITWLTGKNYFFGFILHLDLVQGSGKWLFSPVISKFAICVVFTATAADNATRDNGYIQ